MTGDGEERGRFVGLELEESVLFMYATFGCRGEREWLCSETDKVKTILSGFDIFAPSYFQGENPTNASFTVVCI